jgi:hypothetical protein
MTIHSASDDFDLVCVADSNLCERSDNFPVALLDAHRPRSYNQREQEDVREDQKLQNYQLKIGRRKHHAYRNRPNPLVLDLPGQKSLHTEPNLKYGLLGVSSGPFKVYILTCAINPNVVAAVRDGIPCGMSAHKPKINIWDATHRRAPLVPSRLRM